MAITPTQLDQTAAQMVTELIDIDMQLEPLNARKKEIEKYLKGLEYGKYTNGVFDVTVSPSKRFNKARFAEAFPYEKNPNFYKQPAPEPDTKMIAPAVKEAFSDEYDPRLTIK